MILYDCVMPLVQASFSLIRDEYIHKVKMDFLKAVHM